LCPEGLSTSVSNNCSVQSSSGLNDPEAAGFDIIQPVAENGYVLSVSGFFNEAQVTDITGKTVAEEATSDRASIDMANMPSGIYILRITENDKSYSRKFSIH
jgi:hypothetical protein